MGYTYVGYIQKITTGVSFLKLVTKIFQYLTVKQRVQPKNNCLCFGQKSRQNVRDTAFKSTMYCTDDVHILMRLFFVGKICQY